ncbi:MULTISPECIES: transglutaminase-like domain-containing protein [Bradyrhizobium]|uniref:transglutaminase-like domain-containing protein n=1 Tax=Bradyrhizobium japonicum TaxID=375 RepID=UPI0003FB1915|nr:transglutaminase family protein [Bradyrhizobium japonicum]
MYSASELLASTPYVDSGSAEIREFVARHLPDAADLSPTEKAIRLFDAVRDQIRYNPFNIGTTADEYRASRIATQPTNYCVPKAIMLTAALRAAGVPAAVGFADVRNHLNSPKLAELMETDLFIYHGYVTLWLDGQQFKVTPAFNTEMCERFGVKQLVFDGKHDALFHEFDVNSQRHMEYVNDRGWFVDPPIGQLLQDFHATYPKLWQSSVDRVQVRDMKFHGER